MGRILAWMIVAATLAAPAAAAANPFSFNPIGRGFRAQDTSLWLTFGKNRKSEEAKAAGKKDAKEPQPAAAAGAGAGSAAVRADTPCECPCPGEGDR